MCLTHVEEEDAGNDEDPENDNPGGIEGVTEEFMVHFTRAVKEQPGTFYLQLPTCKDFQRKETVKQEGGDGIDEGSPDPSDNDKCCEEPPDGGS